MKTQLSPVLPVWKACQILGTPTVRRIVASLLSLRHRRSSHDDTSGVEDEEVELLCKALHYRHPPPDYPDTPLPPTVAQSWKRWMSMKALQLDKATLLCFLVPASVQPHAGPSGHMGLFDCWVYALQSHSSSSSAAYYGGAAPAQTILVPDVLILLAVCKQYRALRLESLFDGEADESESSEVEEDDIVENGGKEDNGGNEEDEQEQEAKDPATIRKEKVIWCMALLAYRIYDSYQKKGKVARDTVHRFLTDVYGEDSYKETEAQALLDVIFEDKEHDTGWLHATVTEMDFCRRVLETLPVDDVVSKKRKRSDYILLDWIATLASNMIPKEEIPPSVAAYLETMNYRPLPLCDMYGLADHRLYEIKRRFHSMVQTSSPVIVGDPMSNSEDEAAAGVEEATGTPQPQSPPLQQSSQQVPKHVITEAAFCEALSSVNDEMGSGGYLPESIARLVFRAGCNRYQLDGNTHLYWSLYHVLHFGCIAVRRNLSSLKKATKKADEKDTGASEEKAESIAEAAAKEESLIAPLRFLFSAFQMAGVDREEMDRMDTSVLNRTQVAQMLLLMNDFADFRRSADASVSADESEHTNDGPSTIINEAALEDSLVEEDAAFVLGILPKKLEKSARVENPEGRAGTFVKLKYLVDYALSGTATSDAMSFEEFCQWEKDSPKGGPPTRLAFLVLELQLVAAVLFGIPPTEASMEVRLIGEIEGRHKERYPQSEVSRRGPRGTIWYLIDSEWLKQWAAMVKAVAKTDENADDGRADPKSDKVRGLGRISNTKLLAEDGTLALRPDIRWKHDYEILPPLGWSALQAWYDGGPPIYRSVVRYVTSGAAASPHASSRSRTRIPTENELELYPFFVTVYLCDATSRGEARPFQQNYQLSRVSPVLVMLLQLCKELDVDPDRARLWVLENDPLVPRPENAPDDWILNLEMNIVEQRKRRGNSTDQSRGITLLLELKDKKTGLWPRGVDGKEWSFKAKSEGEHTKSDLGDGIVGLYNMGNTCYLNSSIQCLSHTPVFREYFTSKAYLRDINKTNPLGHEGQLAQVSAVLINSLWKRFNQNNTHPTNRVKAPGSYAMVTAPSLTPKTFKDSLGKFNDHFAGNEQHDAQELLAFLLGGLSEDLNRIVEKPYIEAPDSDGRPDHELADIWWSNHLKREMSIIVALFTGQYKSLLTCRTCNYESARFEPFSFLQLPLPEDDFLPVSLILYPLKTGADTMKYSVRVKSDGKLREVLLALARILHEDEAASNGGKAETDEDGKLQAIFQKKASNLAVVDLRDGYIAKIAPNSWALQDLQNKDTGELPVLHVYELEPLPDAPFNEPATSEDDATESSAHSESEKKGKRGFLAVAQRRSEVMSKDYLHPFAHRVFGTPLLMRVDDLENRTGREIYDVVAKRLRNVVPRAAQRFLDGDATANGFDKKPKLTDDTADGQRRANNNRTTTDMEMVSAGSVPRYGFRLRLTSRDGRRCLTCPWYECCIGCLVPDDNSTTVVMDGDSIVADWHFAVDLATSGFGTRSSPMDPISRNPPAARPKMYSVPVKNHSSCGAGSKKPGHGGAITLEDCLDAFAKEERIPEAYCSKCKEFRVQTKRMSLWRLPPVVIIHLKRFQFTQHMRRKLRDLVIFPVEGLDLSRIMAPDSHSTEEGAENGDSGGLKDKGREEGLYDLYGVVHHQGALSGGHYVASLKSEFDGQWRLFNDAQIYEIHSRDVVDASAYILFYIRRDVAKAKLSDYWDVRGEGEGMSEEDLERLVKGRSERCVIS